jgi:hypothetical protein
LLGWNVRFTVTPVFLEMSALYRAAVVLRQAGGGFVRTIPPLPYSALFVRGWAEIIPCLDRSWNGVLDKNANPAHIVVTAISNGAGGMGF